MNYSEIKNWLESHAHRYFEPKDEEFKVMLQILQKHHNFKNWKFQDVLAFKITRSPKKKAIQVLVNFAQNSDDGSKRKGKGKEKWRNVSWKACCDDIKAKKITRHAKINQAMRFSIKPQIKQFRTQNPNEICDICRTTQHIEVDHYMQLFSDIRDNFLKLENNDIDYKFWWDNKNTTFRFSEKEIEARWFEYHLQEARYRYLCSDCNKKAYKKANSPKII